MHFAEIFAIENDNEDGKCNQQQAEDARHNVVDKRPPTPYWKVGVFKVEVDCEGKVEWSFND